MTDLPLSGRVVQLVVIARRFRCDAVLCGRQIFTERFSEGVLVPSARRTTGLDGIVHHLGLALGGRPAAMFAKRLMLPVSNDTLLRVVRRRSRAPSDLLKVVGIDDWAWRRNHRYASIICNLERRRIVTLLPDREPATALAWFAAHPTIGIIARDRGGGYGEAAAKALPHAVQVADRWHLMENASRAFLDAVRKSMRQVRSVIGATTIDPELLTAAERIQYEGYLRREETGAADLEELILLQLAPFRGGGRFSIKGHSVALRLEVSQAMALVLNELATNATKYGALSVPEGRVSLTWNVSAGTVKALSMEWAESDGPSVRQPNNMGIGSKLIDRAIPGATVLRRYEPHGFTCSIKLPLD